VEGISYPGHVHFTTLKSDKTWDLDIYTTDVICRLNIEQMKTIVSSNKHLIINSLSKEMFKNEGHIPNSHCLSFTELKKKNKKNIKSTIDNFVRYHSKKLNNDKIPILETPLVIYCYSNTCNSSHNLIELLHKYGYTNTIEYPGGIQEWKDQYKLNFGSNSINNSSNVAGRVMNNKSKGNSKGKIKGKSNSKSISKIKKKSLKNIKSDRINIKKKQRKVGINKFPIFGFGF